MDPFATSRQCFVSYSHRDHADFTRLLSHIKAAVTPYGVTLWYDRRIKAGNYWNNSIQSEIKKSSILIAITTNDFFSSDYIFSNELPAMIEQHKNSNALFVPVILRECCWMNYFGNYIEVVPKDAKHNLVPVYKWKDREEALAVAANAIGSAIEGWFGIIPNQLFAMRSSGGKP